MKTQILQPNEVLKTVAHDEENIMTIDFGKYKKQYFGVDKSIAYALMYSKTPLEYFNKNIKNTYINQKIK